MEQKRIKKKLIRKTNDLKFLVQDEEQDQSSDSEFGEEVYKQLFKENETVLKEMQETTTIKLMQEAGRNDYLQAVLQPLMAIEDFVAFFLNMEYQVEGAPEQPLCEILTLLCKRYFQKEIEMYSDEQRHNINISFMHSFELLNNNFPITKRQNAKQVFEWMLNTLKTETGFDNKNHDNIIHKSFYIEINNQIICQMQHLKEVRVLSMFHMLKKGQKISEYIETAFKSTFLKQGCHVERSCKSKITKGQRRIQFLP